MGEKMKRPKDLAAKLELRTIPEPNSGCLLWIGSVNGDGYGACEIDGKYTMVHRAVYEQAHGPIRQGLLVCHRCDVPACVNLAHLFLGTPFQNRKDAQAKGRLPAGESTWCAKLTEQDVREIRAARKRGETCESLAARYGVHNSGITSSGKKPDFFGERKEEKVDLKNLPEPVKRLLAGQAIEKACTDLMNGFGALRIALDFGGHMTPEKLQELNAVELRCMAMFDDVLRKDGIDTGTLMDDARATFAKLEKRESANLADFGIKGQEER